MSTPASLSIVSPSPSPCGFQPVRTWCRGNETLRMILLGTICVSSPLRKFRGLTNTLIKYIFTFHSNEYLLYSFRFYKHSSLSLPKVKFPKFTGIQINMMPIIMGREGLKKSLPSKYSEYLPLILACPMGDYENGKIGYLTIDEQEIPIGYCHRRPGLHTESPGYIVGLCGELKRVIHWGGHTGGHKCRGGIYMASNISNTCRVWDYKIKKNYMRQVVGPGGDIECLRPLLGKGRLLPANQICWITDMSPHESLVITKDHLGEANVSVGPDGVYRVKRQFFRLVTGLVSVWYSKHSTPNPLGITPPKTVKILDYDKFLTEFKN